jgi:hypothetical protein
LFALKQDRNLGIEKSSAANAAVRFRGAKAITFSNTSLWTAQKLGSRTALGREKTKREPEQSSPLQGVILISAPQAANG